MKRQNKCDSGTITKVRTRQSAINIFSRADIIFTPHSNYSTHSVHYNHSIESKDSRRKNTMQPQTKPSTTHFQRQISLSPKVDQATRKANKIRTTLLLQIASENSKQNRSESCKINSMTPIQISACYDAIEVTINNPVEIGTPTYYLSKQSYRSDETPKERISLKDNCKADNSAFMQRLRMKKTISGGKFQHFVETSIVFRNIKKTQARIDQKETKEDHVEEGFNTLQNLVSSLRKSKKKKKNGCKRIDLFNEGLCTATDSPQSCFILKRKSHDYEKSVSESDDDDDTNTEHINKRYTIKGSNTTTHNQKNKAMTSLAFTSSNSKIVKFSSFKSHSSQYNQENDDLLKTIDVIHNQNEEDDHTREYSNDQSVRNDLHRDHDFHERVIILHQDDEYESTAPPITIEPKQSCPKYLYESISMLQSAFGKKK